MHTICAWCRAVLKPGVDRSDRDAPISHGICEGCVGQFLHPGDDGLRRLLSTFDTPVVMVDVDMRLLEANDAALAALGKTRADTVGYRGGDAFNCVNASRPEGCGRTPHCGGCTLRGTVNQTYETGQPVSGLSGWMRVRDGADSDGRRMRLSLSTEKVGDVVLLRLDDFRADQHS